MSEQKLKVRVAALEKALLEIAEWTTVSEPPLEPGRYWCYIEELGDLGVSRYQWNCSFNGSTFNVTDGGRVTHWRPLLQPPKDPE